MPRRSRSPEAVDSHRERGRRRRSPSPEGDHQSRHLPYDARPLTKYEYKTHKNLFALYLDVQKKLVFEDLPDHEQKGRFKSFLKKWNRGELPKYWYDPSTLSKANSPYEHLSSPQGPQQQYMQRQEPRSAEEEDASDDNEIGPALPSNSRALGPSIPSLQDLEYRAELDAEGRANERADRRYERKQDRTLQKERLEELAPRADATSHARRQEKRADAASSQRSYLESKGGGDVEVAESDLMGGDGDEGGLEGYKKHKAALDKKKNERAIRKEEILRARMKEREERMQGHRDKEEKTMAMLRELARERMWLNSAPGSGASGS